MSGRIPCICILLLASSTNIQAAEKPKPRPLSDQQVRGLVMALDDPLVQLEALKWCAEVGAGNEELFEPIRKLCQHEDPQIRNAAASAIPVFGERAVEMLLPLLDHTETRHAAVRALGEIGEKAAKAIEPLVKLLADPKTDKNTREAAVFALGGIGEKAVEPLINLL